MKQITLNSTQAPNAVGGYSQALLVKELNQILFVSGQIPETAEGHTPDDFGSQCRLVWENILSQLAAADMTVSNLVKVTTFLSKRKYADENGDIRRDYLGNHAPALTVIISGIYDEKWLLEIEAIAAA